MVKCIYGGIMKKVIDFIKKYIIIIINFLKQLINKIIIFIKFIFNKISKFIKNIINNISDFFKNRKNNKKQSKIKLFFIGVGAYIGSVFSYLISKPKKKKEVDINLELKKINRNILNIEKSIENETTPLVLKMYKKEVNKKINKLKNIKNVKTREETKLVKEEEEVLLNIKEKIDKCEKKLKNINYEEKRQQITEELQKEDITNKEEVLNKNIRTTNISKKDKVVATIKSIPNKVISNTRKVSNKIKKGALIAGTAVVGAVANIIPKKEKEEKKKKIENINEDVLVKELEDKKLKEKIRELNNKINKTYSEIGNDELELKKLKEKVKDLKEEYIKLTKNEKFKDLKTYKNINDIDPNHLVYHDKAIDSLIDYIEKEIINQKKELKQVDKKEEKKQTDFDNSDIMLAKESIKKDIKLSIEDIKKIKVDMNTIPKKYKKPNLINKLSNFFKYSINVGISLIPFGIFKNKLLATLTSGIILNNRIRSMNSIVNNEEVNFIQYESILSSLNNRQSCLENTNYVLLDTVNQIDTLKLKLELMEVNDIEKDKLLISLDEMKLDLLEENLKIETMLEEMNGLKSKKVKKKVA